MIIHHFIRIYSVKFLCNTINKTHSFKVLLNYLLVIKMSKLTDVDFYISQLDDILKENGVNDIKKGMEIK